MIGMLATSAGVAEYAVARKLAELAEIGNRLLAPVFTPRMRYALIHDDKEGLSKEYAQNRFIAGFVSLGLLTIYFIIGKPLLGIFGDYVQAWPILLILVGGFVLGNLHGASGRYLNMNGYANMTLLTTIVLLILVVILNYLMIPIWGPIGAALSTAIAILLVNNIIAYMIWRFDKFATLSISLMMTMLVVFIGCISWVIYPSNSWLIAGITIVISNLIFLIGQRYMIKDMISLLVKSKKLINGSR